MERSKYRNCQEEAKGKETLGIQMTMFAVPSDGREIGIPSLNTGECHTCSWPQGSVSFWSYLLFISSQVMYPSMFIRALCYTT